MLGFQSTDTEVGNSLEEISAIRDPLSTMWQYLSSVTSRVSYLEERERKK